MADGLEAFARIWMALSGLCALAVALDILFLRRQPMAVMNLVWPLTVLYAGPMGLAAYAAFGRAPPHRPTHGHPQRPRWQSVAIATTHCGSGCTLGDLLVEGVPHHWTLLGSPVFAGWLMDYGAAFAFGIAFQYFSIRPMKKLPAGAALRAALKADAASLSAWQLGMYGFMAIALFVLFSPSLPKTSATFWLMMQIAMLCGFAVALPVNWLLLRRGLKEAM